MKKTSNWLTCVVANAEKRASKFPKICSVAKKFHKTSDGGGSVEISITQLSLQLYKRIFEIYSGPLTSRFRNEFHE